MYTKYSEFPSCDNANAIQMNSEFVNFNQNGVESNEIVYFDTYEKPVLPKVRFSEKVEHFPPTEDPVEKTSLLPVLDAKFNLREICKQSILCEDHLSQKEKSCRDCIMKHFLALEALAEEAITLDKDTVYPDIVDLPTRIREIQKDWYEHKKNGHECSQQLRSIRKNLMESSFPIIFAETCSSNICSR